MKTFIHYVCTARVSYSNITFNYFGLSLFVFIITTKFSTSADSFPLFSTLTITIFDYNNMRFSCKKSTRVETRRIDLYTWHMAHMKTEWHNMQVTDHVRHASTHKTMYF